MTRSWYLAGTLLRGFYTSAREPVPGTSGNVPSVPTRLLSECSLAGWGTAGREVCQNAGNDSPAAARQGPRT